MKKLCLATLALTLSWALSAATITVSVIDRDLDIPLEGATISLQGFPEKTVTGSDGIANLELPPDFKRGLLITELPGYLGKRITVTADQQKVSVALSITDVIEGKELVVERTVPGKTDEKAGVSVVMNKDDMKTTANFGMVEDVMSSIMTLPGVGFSGGWNAQPSIRGGYPEEMGCVLDDVYIINPFHWGGAFSIFNPNMVETAKMSHGIFSSRYGRAMSGLLEVTTVKPKSDEVRFNVGISTISADAFAQVPLGQKASVFLGGKVTYLETLQILYDDIIGYKPRIDETMKTMPYIRDFYTKLYYDPSPELSIAVNGFVGTDGVGVEETSEEDGITTESKFDWSNLQGFAALHINWMPTSKNRVHLVGAYNNHTYDIDIQQLLSGTHAYSDAFLQEYGSLTGGATGYSMDGVDTTGFSRQTVHQGQAKLEADFQVFPNHVLTFGAEGILQASNIEEQFNTFYISDLGEYPELKPERYTLDAEGNRVINSSAYALWAFGAEESTLNGELGLRCEHYYLWNDNWDFNTLPVLNPRLSANWTPVRNRGILEKLTISAGTGLFAMFPITLLAAEDRYNIDDFEFGPNRAWFQVVGVETQFPNAWSFRIEGFYKHYFNRLYVTGFPNNETNQFDLEVADDGYGYATGFDFMIRKREGRYLDGYLSYSFVYAQYKNPTEPRGETTETMWGEPLDEWFFPQFHRFHTLNLVLNWKPANGWTVSLMGSFATGMPKEEVGEITMYPVLYNGQVIERYRRSSFYSDTLRTEFSCPVDLRLSYSNYFKNSKLRWEYYVGAEDILVNLYKPKGNTQFNPYTGKEIKDSDSADFNIGVPMFSVGYKLSY